MQAGCLYGPVGTSGPNRRVIVSSPASNIVPGARTLATNKRSVCTNVDFMEWTFGGTGGDTKIATCRLADANSNDDGLPIRPTTCPTSASDKPQTLVSGRPSVNRSKNHYTQAWMPIGTVPRRGLD